MKIFSMEILPLLETKGHQYFSRIYKLKLTHKYRRLHFCLEMYDPWGGILFICFCLFGAHIVKC